MLNIKANMKAHLYRWQGMRSVVYDAKMSLSKNTFGRHLLTLRKFFRKFAIVMLYTLMLLKCCIEIRKVNIFTYGH
jgi:hypothetical protein